MIFLINFYRNWPIGFQKQQQQHYGVSPNRFSILESEYHIALPPKISVLTPHNSRKVQESILYVWDQVLSEWSESDVSLDRNIAAGLVHFIAKAISSTEPGHVFLRARGYLLAGTLAKDSVSILGDQCKVFLEQTIQASTQDPDGVVQISCLKVLQK